MNYNTMCPAYDEIMFLMTYQDKRYSFLDLNSKNKKEFEKRCYEINMCNKIFLYTMEHIQADPEDILYQFQLGIFQQYMYFKNNKKRILFIEQMESVICDLLEQLKIYRGEI